jgi:hypothetical protein
MKISILDIYKNVEKSSKEYPERSVNFWGGFNQVILHHV